MFKPMTIAKEPVGKTYLDLVRFAAREGSTFSLVWREQLDFDQAAGALLAALLPDLIEEKRREQDHGRAPSFSPMKPTYVPSACRTNPWPSSLQ